MLGKTFLTGSNNVAPSPVKTGRKPNPTVESKSSMLDPMIKFLRLILPMCMPTMSDVARLATSKLARMMLKWMVLSDGKCYSM